MGTVAGQHPEKLLKNLSGPPRVLILVVGSDDGRFAKSVICRLQRVCGPGEAIPRSIEKF
jgi:hypothetical protein